ncbi:MAG: hypothetical protein ACRD99_04395 [Nitrososphaera sp.]
MTDFSKAVAACIADWGKRASECDGSDECVENASRQLRDCLDRAFPDSEKLNLQGDKVNYMLSSVFFLANRLAKACEGLAEFDRAVGSAEELSRQAGKDSASQDRAREFSKELDDILARYF